MTTTLNVLSEISKSLKDWAESSKKIEEDTKQKLLKYFNWILAIMRETIDENEKLDLILEEKRKFEGKVIEAKINKDGFDKQYYQQYLDIIISPLLQQIEKELELNRKRTFIETAGDRKLVSKINAGIDFPCYHVKSHETLWYYEIS